MATVPMDMPMGADGDSHAHRHCWNPTLDGRRGDCTPRTALGVTSAAPAPYRVLNTPATTRLGTLPTAMRSTTVMVSVSITAVSSSPARAT